MIVVGIDPSLTSTGLARVTHDSIRSAPAIELAKVKSVGHEGDTLIERHVRLRGLATSIITFARGADLVVIETPAYSKSQGSQHDRSGLWWLCSGRLMAMGIPVAEVPSTSRTKYATGKGIASKDDVVRAVQRRFKGNPEVDAKINGLADNDLADALAIASLGARFLGCPVDGDVPVASVDAVAKLADALRAAVELR